VSIVPDPVKRPVDPATGRVQLGGRSRRDAPQPEPARSTHIYLAGKVYKHCWRGEFVPGLHYAYTDMDLAEHEPWPTMEMVHGLTYVGPFFTRCDHGCAHGSSAHGFAGGCITTGNSPEYMEVGTCRHNPGCDECDNFGFGINDVGRKEVARRCIEAIDRADWVIAVVGDDAHGTIAEVGYALGKGKKVVVIPDGGDYADPVYAPNGERREAWFPFAMPGVTTHYSVRVLLELIGEANLWRSCADMCESPIEKSLWRAMAKHRDKLGGFRPQFIVGRYRLDFADAERKLAIEADGFEFHTSKDQFTKDRQRQRDLELDGWRFIRFSGSEIHADADACAKQIVRWVESLT
jgi:very-short-patch-repair endonuclease/nucleoside 2-deoxyribosyltransferase